MSLPRLLAGALALACAGCGEAARVEPTGEPDLVQPVGIWSSVQRSPDSGAVNGFEVDFSVEDGEVTAEYTVCAETCIASVPASVAILPDGSIELKPAVGRTVSGPHGSAYLLTPDEEGFTLKAWNGEGGYWDASKAALPFELNRLGPLDQPYGLVAARGGVLPASRGM